MSEAVRIDKWLWAARFFKTRALARDAITGGKVHLHGRRTKPGRAVSSGDSLTINRGDERFEISIAKVTPRRVSAPLAREMYIETDESIALREAVNKQRKLDSQAHSERVRRPGKRDRRKIIDFTRGEN